MAGPLGYPGRVCESRANTPAPERSTLLWITSSEIDELIALLYPMTHAIICAGRHPLDSPMGLNLRDVRQS